MSKFNNTVTNTTTNRSGSVAYKMNDKERLVCAALTSMFCEPKFYGSTDNDIVTLATNLCQKGEGEFVAKLAVYARTVFNMRSVSHVLTAIVAHETTGSGIIRTLVPAVCVRADDMLEITVAYEKMYGKPFPNGMKRGLAEAMMKFNEYQYAKYNGGNKEFKFTDLLRICHPKALTSTKAELFGKILSDTLETPYTWEVELSRSGNTKEVWESLIESHRLGYMAMLRNLRNMYIKDVNMTPVLEKLADPVEVAKSKQFPFRFYAAYREIDKFTQPKKNDILLALNKALEASVENMEKIEGRTLVAVDVSGSMDNYVSKRSDVTCRDIAELFGAMSSRLCEDATVVYFNSAASYSWNPMYKKGYKVEHYGKWDNIMANVGTHGRGGGTDMSLPLVYALDEVTDKPFDRVIYFSDNENNMQQRTMQGLADKYRRDKNPNFWVHAVDLQGYGTQQFCGEKFNLIAGWDESVWSFINMAEKGFGSLVDSIEAVSL